MELQLCRVVLFRKCRGYFRGDILKVGVQIDGNVPGFGRHDARVGRSVALGVSTVRGDGVVCEGIQQNVTTHTGGILQ